jgi:hypothetical protein
MAEYYLGQVGLKIELDTLDDPAILAASTALKIRYRKPNGLAGFWAAQRKGAKLTYTTTDPSTLDFAGDWGLQAYSKGASWEILGKTVKLPISIPGIVS